MINSNAAVLITGATSGLGRKSAFALGAVGRTVIIHGRQHEAVGDVVHQISKAGGTALPFVANLDDLEELNNALQGFPNLPLHGVMANAGVISRQPKTLGQSAQGYDMTFAVNVLAHQLIFMKLADKILEDGRIVVVTSGVHDPKNQLSRFARVPEPQWVDVHHLAHADEALPESGLSNGFLRYSTSKLLNIFQARILQEQHSHVDVFALNPGFMADTNLVHEVPSLFRPLLKTLGQMVTPFVKNMRLSSTTAGDACSLFEGSKWKNKGFAYIDGGKIKSPSSTALRDDLPAELWKSASEMVKSSTCL
ncbi:MAG: SDR family NAD(P)-dependent oxidoreductase [Acidimicrobiales bacterium]|nr:SDR family NAD(P)-dependent oxidoreductase [Acidimicrobiales bacterium]